MNAPVLGYIHHLDITVGDLARSRTFYARVMPLLGFRPSASGPIDANWAGAGCEVGLVEAHPGFNDHDRYSPGLHHLAFNAASRAAVDDLHAQLVKLQVRILDAPAEYPQYAPGYYAVFFADPDGIKLEYVYTSRWPA